MRERPTRTPYFESTQRRQPSLLTAQPIAPVQVQSTATTIYTAKDDADFWIKHLWVANVSAGATTFTLYFVPSGGSPGTSNTVIYQKSLAVNVSEVVDVAVGHRLPEGASIQALCATNNDVNIGGWGYDQAGEP